MARITEAALDDKELRRLHTAPDQPRGLGGAVGAPVVRATTSPVVSLALLVGGAGAVLAPDAVPYTVTVLGAGALAVGSWLLGRNGQSRDALVASHFNALFAERREVIRAAIAVAALRGDDAAARRAGTAVARSARDELPAAVGDDGGAGRAVLRTVPSAGHDAGESLALDADADEL
jgi:hypothetical protein